VLDRGRHFWSARGALGRGARLSAKAAALVVPAMSVQLRLGPDACLACQPCGNPGPALILTAAQRARGITSILVRGPFLEIQVPPQRQNP
jgi:hypothetical protein